MIAWVARSHTLVVSVGITLSLHCFCLHWIALILIGGFVFVCLFLVFLYYLIKLEFSLISDCVL